MRGSQRDLPVAFELDGVVIQQADWGDMTASLERFPAGLDTSPIFQGLPNDRCQCAHWGYVVTGRFRAVYEDRDETLSTGAADYLSPGHTTIFDEDTTVIEFTARGEYRATMEVAARNVTAMQLH